MDDSKFNLWRATFSFCFVDGFLSPEETAYLDEKLKTLPLTPEQKKILMSDLKSPPDIEGLFPLITRLADRGFLVNNIRMLSRIDNLTESEKVKIQSLLDKVMKKVDVNELTNVVAEDEHASYHEDEVFDVHNKNLYSERIVKKLMKVLNPGDYKYPKDK